MIPGFYARLERSFELQEREFQKTRDDVVSLKNQQGFIQRDIGTLTTTVQALMAKMDERSKPNWPAIALAATMFIAVVPGMGFVMTTYVAAAIAPVANATSINATDIKHDSDALRLVEATAASSRAADENSRADRTQLNERARVVDGEFAKEVADRRASSAAVRIALAEVETQMRAVCNQENLRFAHQERVNAMVWDERFDKPKYPTANFFAPPCVAGGNSILEGTP